jgi:hypothetical protein
LRARKLSRGAFSGADLSLHNYWRMTCGRIQTQGLMNTGLLASTLIYVFVLFAPDVLPAQPPEPVPQPGAIAIAATAVGAVPPYLLRDMVDEPGAPTIIHIRYGMRTQEDVRTHAFLGTGELPFLYGRLGVSGGIQRGPDFTSGIGGVEYQASMSRGMLTADPTGPILNLAIKFEASFSAPLEGELEQSAFAGGISVQMAVPFGSEIRIVPFVTPGIGFGVLSAGGTTEYAPQVMVGGGVVIHNPSRLDFTLGAHRVIADLTATVFGIGITWNR